MTNVIPTDLLTPVAAGCGTSLDFRQPPV